MISYPLELTTARLRLCAPEISHARLIYEAARESYPEIKVWLPWAKSPPDLAEVERHNRNALAKFVTGEAFHFRLFLKERNVLIGTAGVMPVDPAVPSFEVGYWCRSRFTGHGYMTETVEALVRFARGPLRARRVQVRSDERNVKSCRIPERLGFVLEGSLKQYARDNRGRLVTMRVYAKTL